MTIEELFKNALTDPTDQYDGSVEFDGKYYDFYLHQEPEDGSFFFYGKVDDEYIVSPRFFPIHELTPDQVWKEGYLNSESNIFAPDQRGFEKKPFPEQVKDFLRLRKQNPLPV